MIRFSSSSCLLPEGAQSFDLLIRCFHICAARIRRAPRDTQRCLELLIFHVMFTERSSTVIIPSGSTSIKARRGQMLTCKGDSSARGTDGWRDNPALFALDDWLLCLYALASAVFAFICCGVSRKSLFRSRPNHARFGSRNLSKSNIHRRRKNFKRAWRPGTGSSLDRK